MTSVPAPVQALKVAAWLTAGVDDVTRPIAPHSPESVLAKHGDDCWNAGGGGGALPGHVVWQHPDGTTVYSKALVGPALDTIFADGDLPGHAVAFCN